MTVSRAEPHMHDCRCAPCTEVRRLRPVVDAAVKWKVWLDAYPDFVGRPYGVPGELYDTVVALVAPETADVICPTCYGSGMVQVYSSSKPRGSESAMVYGRCPTCPDDGSGNCVGTGKIKATL